ncbi:MAG: PQQ-binding-like beta-propeller repeat protein [Planctomyces sp.]|nr:PQQ-binding-like beta-propeller repeat protein [Planctomyces sp.]
MKIVRSRSLMLALAALLSQPAARAEEWRQFRGQGARGVADSSNLPDEWSATRNVRWKQDIPGRGWSSPIVTGNRILLTSVVSSGDSEEPTRGLYFGGNRSNISEAPHEWRILCLDLETGAELWSRVVHEGLPLRPRHIKNSYASETPVTDGERVYALFGDIGLFALTLDGEPVWSKRFEAFPTRYDWGPAASPVLHEGRVYVVNDNEQESWLAAFDAATGDEAWRVSRAEKSNWATPFIWETDQRVELITPGSGRTRSYSLDGELLYEFGGASSIMIAAPYAAHGLLYVSSGYVGDPVRPIVAVRPGAQGDISLADGETQNDSIAWSLPDAAPYNPTTLVHGDVLYVLHDRGLFAAYDARTGRELYGKQRLPNGRAFTASPWASGDRIYCLSEYGDTFVIRAGETFELLGVNSLEEDELCMATPAIAGDRLLLRTDRRLYCIGPEG